MNSFRLRDTGWGKALEGASRQSAGDIRIICPFIKLGTTHRLLGKLKSGRIKVITRANLFDCYSGVSDLAALDLLLDRGAEVRAVRNLHSKLYLFGNNHAFVTSANLTECALERNHEFGFEAKDPEIFRHCLHYFDGLWKKAGSNLSKAQVKRWSSEVIAWQTCAKPAVSPHGLKDYGVDVGIEADALELPVRVAEANQAFIKFFGEGDNRSPHSRSVGHVVQSAGCHWACTYPKGKRPRQVRDGAVMFMGRLTENPTDTIIFGRGIAVAHVEGRDDATAADIQARDWKERWPHYIRVHHTEFMDGALGDGVSLSEMMSELKSDAFASTQRNRALGKGNTEPRRAFMQQAAVELSPEGLAWLSERLQRAFLKYGKLPAAFLNTLDWPGAAAPGLAKQ